MAEQKTLPTKVSVEKFLNSVTDKTKRDDSFKLLEMMKKVTKQDAKMWGPSIIGFGSYHYKYASGHEGDSALTGFSPRKAAISIYVMCGLKKSPALMKKLGKYKTGVACLYVKKLDDIDMKVLKELISESVKYIKNKKW